eukprot:397023_1
MCMGQVSRLYELEITPASWTFTIWAFIYTWQVLWIIYTLFVTCKYRMNSVIFGKWFYFTFNVANICNALWIITWVNQHIVWSGIILICVAIALISAAYSAHKYMFVNIQRTISSSVDAADDDQQQSQNTINLKWLTNSQGIKTWIYVLVMNGVPFYATWTVIAAHLNIGIILTHKAECRYNVSLTQAINGSPSAQPSAS